MHGLVGFYSQVVVFLCCQLRYSPSSADGLRVSKEGFPGCAHLGEPLITGMSATPYVRIGIYTVTSFGRKEEEKVTICVSRRLFTWSKQVTKPAVSGLHFLKGNHRRKSLAGGYFQKLFATDTGLYFTFIISPPLTTILNI